MALRAVDFGADVVGIGLVAGLAVADLVAGLVAGAISWGDRDEPRLLRAFDGVAAVLPAPFVESFCPFRGVAERFSLGLPSCRCLLILLPPVPASRDAPSWKARIPHVEPLPPHPPRELCQRRPALRAPPHLDSVFWLCHSDNWQYAALALFSDNYRVATQYTYQAL